ncbi:MAG: hypothetical protein Q9222_003772 [Ikaeria aurantiellina]
MSGYVKTPVHDYNNIRSIQPQSHSLMYDGSGSLRDAGYIAYGHSGYAGSSASTIPETYSQDVDQAQFSPGSYYQARARFDSTSTTFSELSSQSVPTITEWNPTQGSQGTSIYIYLKSNYDLVLSSAITVILMFGTRECRGHLTRLDSRSADYDYCLTADTPSFSLTGWRSPEVPVSIRLQGNSGLVVGTLEAGYFRYTDQQSSRLSSPQGMPRKRKLSTCSIELTGSATKRSIKQQLFSIPGSYSPPTPGYSPDFRMPSQGLPSTSIYSPYEAAQSSFRKRSSTFSGGTVRSLMPQTYSEPGWSSSYVAINGQGRKTAFSAGPSSRLSSLPATSVLCNPPLIRTSHLGNPAKSSSVPPNPSASATFNPFPVQPHRATLSINGNLDTMANGWTAEERSTKRRLVRFWRTQTGNTISTNFEPMVPENNLPKCICVSAIWWEERGECYITSVDTIFLLESLVDIKFDVREKNRIRRNVECYRPVTVAKEIEETESFFRVVMGFPAPKPRHIEKAIKVFQWKVLGEMLQRIIGKYSADYQSNPTTLRSSYVPPRISIYGPTSQPTLTSKNSNLDSPCSTSNSTISTATYNSGASWNSATASPDPSQMGQLSQSETLSSQSLPQSYLPTSSTQYTSYPEESLQPTGMDQRGGWSQYPGYTDTSAQNLADKDRKPSVLPR